MTSCGIPCSHIMLILIKKDILMETLEKLISKRWIISAQNLETAIIIKSDELAEFEIETSQYQPSVKQRYLEIKSKAHTIAELGSKTEDNYNKIIEALNVIEQKLLGIVEAHGIRSGRPRTSRITHSTK